MFDKLCIIYGLNFIFNGFIVCVGIVYIKYNYFFYFGVNLVNDLCKYVKNRIKVLLGDYK